MDFHHVSVFLNEAIDLLAIKSDGIYVDCTLGGAGHSKKIAERLSKDGILIGIDQDTDALCAAKERLEDYECKIHLIHSNFENLDSILKDLNIDKIDGILFDLGVSSHQIDTESRGFSYVKDAPLDMRMNKENPFSAMDVVNNYSKEELTSIFYEYGEEKWSVRIADIILEKRLEKPILTTGELVDIVHRAIPKKLRPKDGGHPAKRIFQAIRIEVNKELEILNNTFNTALKHLNIGGKMVVITFHSLEDRITKQFMKEKEKGCICPKELPICTCNHKKEIKILSKGIKPSTKEVEENPRSKSAKIRAFEKIWENV